MKTPVYGTRLTEPLKHNQPLLIRVASVYNNIDVEEFKPSSGAAQPSLINRKGFMIYAVFDDRLIFVAWILVASLLAAKMHNENLRESCAGTTFQINSPRY